MIVNIIAVIIIAACLTAAIGYIVKAKKKGVKCIGCSSGGCCADNGYKHECTCCRDPHGVADKTKDSLK